ncbi:MAG: 4-alpha-glucanotransferase [Segetibacter sp.]|jgi:4-alpha-glucanotransferase|nr:4-alpha-glucanotransferase [Segetibacter sp.]
MTENKRGAGILLHITSLPSVFGIGDMGPEAKKFADFLHRSKQKYWQLLPLNPTEEGQAHSPYSSISSRAGNTLLISPKVLAAEGLFDADELATLELSQQGITNYKEAARVKEIIFAKAWGNFQQGNGDVLKKDFTDFKKKEAGWLDDFALYMLLKQKNDSKPWFQWPDEYKLRDKSALHKLEAGNLEEIEKIKWLQYLFSKQWHELKSYCNNLGIQLFGDLPFYISYDSVDVWAHRHLFSVDKDGKMIGAAGVPPDAFSEDGQLWGMPVFLWDVLKKHNYDWWIGRFRKNMELFDLVRLDHFRAFADYWEVPAEEKTAKNGKWKPGPGKHFFEVVEKEFGKLPFIAEDLGEINEPVYELRDAFNFPGMKILQFAFGDGMPKNPYIPHNYSENFVAYTGTHDNNTIRGWYRQEGCKYHHQIEKYIGKSLTEDDMHIEMCRLAYSSVAKIAILPIQDVLGLDETGRMNTPASGENNWGWRLLPGQVTAEAEQLLNEWTSLYNR